MTQICPIMFRNVTPPQINVFIFSTCLANLKDKFCFPWNFLGALKSAIPNAVLLNTSFCPLSGTPPTGQNTERAKKTKQTMIQVGPQKLEGGEHNCKEHRPIGNAPPCLQPPLGSSFPHSEYDKNLKEPPDGCINRAWPIHSLSSLASWPPKVARAKVRHPAPFSQRRHVQVLSRNSRDTLDSKVHSSLPRLRLIKRVQPRTDEKPKNVTTTTPPLFKLGAVLTLHYIHFYLPIKSWSRKTRTSEKVKATHKHHPKAQRN